jgi:hypothetical protein
MISSLEGIIRTAQRHKGATEEMRGRKGERAKRRFISVHLCVFSVELSRYAGQVVSVLQMLAGLLIYMLE